MAALVQSFPAQQSSPPVTLMQSRPQSSTTTLQAGTPSQSALPAQHHHLTPRNMGGYPNTNTGSNISGSSYRSGYSSAPVAPYAFTSTPGLSNTKSALTGPKISERTSSAAAAGHLDSRNRYPASDSVSSSSSASSDPSLRNQQAQSIVRSKEEHSDGRPNPRPVSTISTNLPLPPISSPTNRPSPDRYRRVNNGRASSHTGQIGGGSAQPSGSGMAAVAAIYTQPGKANSNPSLPPTTGNVGGVGKAPFIGDYTGQLRSQSVDDIHTYRSPSAISNLQQMHDRRRSVGPDAFSPESFQNFVRNEMSSLSQTTNAQLSRPGSAASGSASGSNRSQPGASGRNSTTQNTPRPGNRRTGSTDSSASGNSSRPSSSKRNSTHSTTSSPGQSSPNSPHEINLAHVPPRGSSTDLNKRTTAPSPLSKPMTMSSDSPSASQLPDNPANPNAAPQSSGNLRAEHPTVFSEPRKGMKNRLRRAFSFGSAAELRKVSAVNSLRGEELADKARTRQEKFREEQEAEQARIAKRQEEAGLGEGIYNGQGNFFTGSTDNISVSSTASSASIMIRKMGKGMKKSTRSLVGLFRPRSVVGVPAASGPVTSQPSTGQVSMVTVEAERERVNVNADPHEQVGGGTGFPKLDRNSIESGQHRTLDPNVWGASIAGDDTARKSVVGTDRDRADILATIRRGILKRSGSSSPVAKPVDLNGAAFGSSNAENQRPSSSKQRSDSLKIEGDDYFMSSPRFPAGSSNSAPTSPASMSRYNVSFSPRITFHDTWPSGEYDRRGEIATCNRLTPMLAQQIKEELNTFKMEMDVHEESKVYTHFF
ncbi:unnamed protein product [Tuber melanosporum]|uniref:(Perigord truffle) hypothetical protein n=1 Tax=Tuber melanosporum (strain Mel28) TaxID=656061 RepID=D5GLY7_TUBMM|nr:uncharacterized protein GSTUM_00010322001 [Tuber melanosporum]CAZ85449.1 unnamed protein product [Tuber melanosporum]